MVTTTDPAPLDQPSSAARWVGVLTTSPGGEEITFGPFAAPWHAASVMASEARHRQVAADAGEDAAAQAGEDASAALATDRAAMDRCDVAAPEVPVRRGEDQRRGEEASWRALLDLESRLADPQGYARSGEWVVRAVAIGAMDSAPDAWRWSIRRVMAPLEEIASITWQLGEVAARLPDLVAAARAGGASWSQVGAAHGISRQAAQQRYAGAEDRPTTAENDAPRASR